MIKETHKGNSGASTRVAMDGVATQERQGCIEAQQSNTLASLSHLLPTQPVLPLNQHNQKQGQGSLLRQCSSGCQGTEQT